MTKLVNYPSVGCIVEYMEGNSPQLAVILEEQSGRIRLLMPNRKESKLGLNRLLPWSGPIIPTGLSKDESIQLLEKHRAAREKIASNINAEELWDMAQGEIEEATAAWFAELFESEPTVDHIAAYGAVLLSCKSHFKFHSPEFEIYTEETVQKRLLEQTEQAKRENLNIYGGSFLRLLWDVYCKKRHLPEKDSFEWPEQDIIDLLKNVLEQKISDPENHENSVLWRNLTKSLPDLLHLPLNLATAWGLVPEHYNYLMDRAAYSPDANWHEAYAHDVETMLKKVTDQTEISSDIQYISIDSSSTHDIDDAFYVEKTPDNHFILHLALACPAMHWPFGSALDKAVQSRATSLYLPEQTYHMLPEILAVDTFSLLSQKIRPALCVKCEIDQQGQIISCTPSTQWIKIAANLNFDDCEEILNNSSDLSAISNEATKYVAQIILGEELGILRQKMRIADGAVIIDKPDPKISLEITGEESNPQVKVHLEESNLNIRAQNLVSEMMILASSAIANWAQDNNVPLIYRTQDIAIPKEYAGIWDKPHDMAKIIRSLAPSIMEIQAKPHAGLGLNAYSPITSPLRRYADLINEVQIIHYLEHKEPYFTQEALKDLNTVLNSRIGAVLQIQRFRPRYWKLLYIKQAGDSFWWDATITEENDNFASISLPSEQVMVRARRNIYGERACPGQEVKVRLGKINPLYNEIQILEVMEK